MCSLCVHTFLILTWGLSCRLQGPTWNWLGCHPFHSPDLAAAQHGNAPCCREYRLQIASCPKPAPWCWLGQEVSWHSSPALALPPAPVGSSRGKKNCCSGPFPVPGRCLEPALRAGVGLDELSAALLSLFGWRTAASKDGSAWKWEQLYGVGPMALSDAGELSACGEREVRACDFLLLRWQSLRATGALAVHEEKLHFLQPTAACQSWRAFLTRVWKWKLPFFFFFKFFCYCA